MRRVILFTSVFYTLLLLLPSTTNAQTNYGNLSISNATSSCVDGNPLYLSRHGSQSFESNGYGKLDSVIWRNNGVVVARKSPITVELNDSVTLSQMRNGLGMVARPDGSVYFIKEHYDPALIPNTYDTLIGVKNGSVIYNQGLSYPGNTFITGDKFGNIYLYQQNGTPLDSIYQLSPSNTLSFFNSIPTNSNVSFFSNSPITCDDYGNIYTINADSLHSMMRINSSSITTFQFNNAIIIDSTNSPSQLKYMQISCPYNDRTITILNNSNDPNNSSISTLYYDSNTDSYGDPNLSQNLNGPPALINRSNAYITKAFGQPLYYIDGIIYNINTFGLGSNWFTAMDSLNRFYVIDGNSIIQIDTTKIAYTPTQPGVYDAVTITNDESNILKDTSSIQYVNNGFPDPINVEPVVRYNSNLKVYKSSVGGSLLVCPLSGVLTDSAKILVKGAYPDRTYCDWQVNTGSSWVTAYTQYSDSVGNTNQITGYNYNQNSGDTAIFQYYNSDTSLPANTKVRGVVHSFCNPSNSFTSSTAIIKYVPIASVSSTDTTFKINKGETVTVHLHFTGNAPFVISFTTIDSSTYNPTQFGTDTIYRADTTFKIIPTVSTTLYSQIGGSCSGSNYITTIISVASITSPTVNSFMPTSAATGASITITGTGLTGASAVSFGGTAASSFTVVNDNTITAVVGSGTSGSVSVTNSVGTSSLAGFTITPTYTWGGSTSTDWNNTSNWVGGVVPTSTTKVIIPASTPHTLALTGDAFANSFQLNGSINLNGHSLTLSGPLSGSGTLQSTGAGTLTLSGTDNSIGNLQVTGGSLAISGGSVLVSSQLTVSGGTLNTGGNLTLGSTATGTAIVNYPIGGTINGNITVQRFIAQDQGAAFRDLGVCVTGGTVADLSTQTYSYAGGAWSSSLSSGTSLVPGTGYRAQVNTASGPVTLGNIGSLVSGNVPAAISQGANAYSFVANPYLGQLDFTKVTSSNLQAGFWYLDPTNLSSDGYQGYVFYGVLTGASNTYNGGITPSNYIQPGQGFFVQNQNNGSASSLTFKESAIDNSQSQYNVFGKTALNRIATGLFTGGKNVDGAVVVFNNSFSGGLDQYDATKFSNHGENLTFTVAGTDLCTNAWSLPTVTDVLTLHLYNLKASTPYTLKLDASQFVGNGLVAYLKDNVTSTKTLLSGANNEVAFTTGTDASVYASRYSIVFEAGALPVKNISLTASKMGNNQVAIKWSTTGESNISNYKIERSTNGTSFTELATVSPSTAHNYSYIDATPSGARVGAGVYYRIKVIDNSGAISYSAVAKLTNNHSPLTTIKVYPNPVTGRSFNIGLENTGKYTVSIVNRLGQKVYSTTVNHVDNQLETVSISKQLAAGSYEVTATDATGKTYSTNVIIK